MGSAPKKSVSKLTNKTTKEKPKPSASKIKKLKWGYKTGQAILWEGRHEYDYGIFAFTPKGVFKLSYEDDKIARYILKQKNHVVDIGVESIRHLGNLGWEYKTYTSILV